MITWQHRLHILAEQEAQVEEDLELCRAEIVATIVEAAEQHGASQVSIAAVLGCSQAAVSQRVARQRRRGLRSA